jgi:predicted metal-dependent hydrolase
MQTQTTTKPTRKVPVPRSPALAIGGEIPRHWFGGNAVATHIANGVNLLFPAGERFFVRSVHHFLPRITDPTLRAQVRGFAGQEGRHAKEHERFFAVLSEQGYDVDRFLRFYEPLAARIEALSPAALRLAVTAACEHFTALLAEDALRLRVLDRAHPAMQALLMWHAAEEIEHRAVAFDVLSQVAPSYALRMAGLAMATVLLGGFWTLGTLSLLAQDETPRGQLARQWRALQEGPRPHAVFLRGIRDYMRPGFHPSQSDVDRLADEYIASVGLAPSAA